jgi:hypothetical protein
MTLNQQIEIAEKLPQTQQQNSIAQDNANKAAFAMNMIQRLPQEQAAPAEAPRIPSLGALAIAN